MTVLEASEIQKIIPHRYPMLLVDRIIELEPMKRAVGIKNITMNEMQFLGHFPGDPIMPGVLQLEALAQCSAPILLKMPEFNGKLALYAGVENARFKNIVRPGDKFEMEIELLKIKGPVCKAHGIGRVDGKVAVEADMTFALK